MKIEIFHFAEDILVLPCESRICENCSLTISEIFSIFAKIQDSHQDTLQVKNSLEIALSLTISEIFSMIYFPLKSKMATKSGDNRNYFSPRHRILINYPAGQKFAQNRDIFNVYFPLKSMMAVKSGEN